MAVKTNHLDTTDTTEQIIRQLVKLSESPLSVLVGVHNAFYHGEILREAGLDSNDDDLGELFEGLDKAIAVCKRLED